MIFTWGGHIKLLSMVICVQLIDKRQCPTAATKQFRHVVLVGTVMLQKSFNLKNKRQNEEDNKSLSCSLSQPIVSAFTITIDIVRDLLFRPKNIFFF